MKKTFISALLIVLCFAAYCVSATAAEIMSVIPSKTGVMYYESGDGRVDEIFKFNFYATGDTAKIMMKGAGEKAVVATSPFGNCGAGETIGLETQLFLSNFEGTREFRFWAVDYEGNETEYKEPVKIECYKENGGENTVYSVEVERDVVKVLEGQADTSEKIQLTICTSINTRELRMITENGNVITNISEHCYERGTCDIKNGKKYWEVYFLSEVLGKRTFTFQAMKNGAVTGDAKSVDITVLSWEEWEKANTYGGAGTGTKPGTDEGFSSGDDKNATGNEDGVENGGTGNSDIPSDERQEENADIKQNEEQKEAVKEEIPEQTEKIEETENAEKEKPVSAGGYVANEENFLSFGVPANTSTIVIEFPDGEKFNAVDQEEKNLAKKYTSKDGSYTWVMWIGDRYDFNDLDIKVLDENYTQIYNYIIFQTHPFTDAEKETYTQALENEHRIATNPNQRIIELRIGDEMMTVDGVDCEVDPGRGTKPLIIDGRTMLPIRAIVEALGGTVGWEGKEKQVDIRIFNKDIEFWIDSDKMKWNNISEEIDVPAQIINDRTMLPVKFVAECLDHTTVDWEPKTKTVTITYNY